MSASEGISAAEVRLTNARVAAAAVAENAPEGCRELFPMTRETAYLDTGSAGLSFAGQETAAAQFYAHKRSGYVDRATWIDKAAQVRALVGELIGVAPDEVEFVSGTTHGLNLVAHAIPWRPGDEIVVAEDEFPSVRYCWQAAERAGAVLRRVRIDDEAEREDALIAALGDRTRLLCASHVHSNLGTKLDLDRIGRKCRDRGVLFVVDGIHALGAVPVRLDHVDVYCAGVFKWLLAGFGLAVLYRGPRARAAMQPPFRGYLNPAPHPGFECAHVDYPGLFALDASLRLMGQNFGWDLVQARTAALVDLLEDALQRFDLSIVAPAGRRGGVASIAVPDSDRARTALADQHIHVAAKGPMLRATPFFYNSGEDIRRFATALGRIVRQ